MNNENNTLSWIEIFDILKNYQFKIIFFSFLLSVFAFAYLVFFVPPKYSAHFEIYELSKKRSDIYNTLLRNNIVSPILSFKSEGIYFENQNQNLNQRQKYNSETSESSLDFKEAEDIFISQIKNIESGDTLPLILKTFKVPKIYESSHRSNPNLSILKIYDQLLFSTSKTDTFSSINYDVLTLSFPDIKSLDKEEFTKDSNLIFSVLFDAAKTHIITSTNEQIEIVVNNYLEVLSNYSADLQDKTYQLENEHINNVEVMKEFLSDQFELAEIEGPNKQSDKIVAYEPYEPSLKNETIDHFTLSSLYLNEGVNTLQKRKEQIERKNLDWFKENDNKYNKLRLENNKIETIINGIKRLKEDSQIRLSESSFENLYKKVFITSDNVNSSLITVLTLVIAYILLNAIALLNYTYRLSRSNRS